VPALPRPPHLQASPWQRQRRQHAQQGRGASEPCRLVRESSESMPCESSRLLGLGQLLRDTASHGDFAWWFGVSSLYWCRSDIQNHFPAGLLLFKTIYLNCYTHFMEVCVHTFKG
jgi:hypothetical protein